MDERTVINPDLSGPVTAFRYREDYLFFGLLVRHGLAQPEDHPGLVQAQQDAPGTPPLAKMLCETIELSDKTRADIEELLRLLATKEMRNYLPQEMPAIRTLIEKTHQLTPEIDEMPTRQLGVNEVQTHVLVTSPGAAPTQTGGSNIPTVASNSFPSNASGTFAMRSMDLTNVETMLSKDEVERVERAKAKSNLIGQIIEGHLVMDKLGGGGQGDVYLAKQLSLGRYVALKKLEIPSWADAARFLETFRQEARTLGAINHARIVKVYEIFQQGQMAFFTMEYLNGKTVKDLVKDSGGPMPIDVVANLACQACSALGRTAQDGLVHRDIKPANMMLDENGDLKIVDFGLAGAAATFEGSGGFAGTPQFCSPEQASSLPLTPSSDQYSLGLTLYYMLTGEAPFKGSKVADVLEAQIIQAPRAPSEINPDLPRSVERALMRMLEKEPSKRFASFDECYEAWEKALSESGRRRAVPGTSQLLGESLMRFGRKEKDALIRRSVYLGLAWVLLMFGTILAEFRLRSAGAAAVLEFCGNWGSGLLLFSLSCIAYVAMARRKWLPTIGSLRAWLYTHIATAIPSVAMILIHSGNFIRGALPGGSEGKPLLSIIVSIALVITAASGSIGLLIFRALRRQLQLNELELRGQNVSPREAMAMVLGARFLSGWRLVHYPLAILFFLLSIVHIVQALRFSSM